MSFPAYSAYMDAGVDWLGKIPEHWQQKWLGLLAVESRTAFVDGPFGSDLKSSDYQDEGIPLIQLNNIRDGQHVLRNMKFISEEKRNELSRHSAFPGDIVIAKMADPVARSAIVSDEFSEYVIVADCVKMTPDLTSVDLSFLIWAINSDCVRISAELMSSGVTRIRINLGQVKKLRIPYPPLREQTQIARFLDHETARIDALIEEQQRLIELLKEKRQAVISHAVTKGLDPTVPMKDSGVEWLGEVPAHWEVGGLTRFIGPVVDYRGRTPTKVDDGIFLVTARNIRNGRIDYEASEEYADPESAESLLARGRPEIGDLLFTMEAPLGQVALIDRTDIALAQRIVKFRGEASVMRNHYLMFWFMSTNCQARLETLATGSTALGIKSSKLGMIECLAPTLNEQDAIVSHIQRESEKNDALVYEAENVIGLLQERRSALISAAVTGKIDVRGWQPPASVQAPELAQEAV